MPKEFLDFDTSKILENVGNELIKVPNSDKSLHFSASYALCVYTEMFEKNLKVPSAICVFRALIASFKEGLRKEYSDAGKDFTQSEQKLNEILILMETIYSEFKKNGINEPAHESDLFANLCGIGAYAINQSLRGLSWIYSKENKNENIS